MTDWIIPFLCGLGASILSAWGVGGGTLLLLVMTLFLDVDQRTAQGINLLFFLPTAASALVCHARGGYLDKPTLKSAVPLAVAAALAGAWIATNLDVAVLRKPFGVTVLQTGTRLEDDIWGLQVLEVTPGSAADLAGIREGDFVLAAGGRPVETSQELLRIRRQLYVGDQVTMEIWRDGERMEVTLTLNDPVE